MKERLVLVIALLVLLVSSFSFDYSKLTGQSIGLDHNKYQDLYQEGTDVSTAPVSARDIYGSDLGYGGSTSSRASSFSNPSSDDPRLSIHAYRSGSRPHIVDPLQYDVNNDGVLDLSDARAANWLAQIIGAHRRSALTIEEVESVLRSRRSLDADGFYNGASVDRFDVNGDGFFDQRDAHDVLTAVRAYNKQKGLLRQDSGCLEEGHRMGPQGSCVCTRQASGLLKYVCSTERSSPEPVQQGFL